MTLKINESTDRLLKSELEDYKDNSGITKLQYDIIKMRYYNADEPTVIAICNRLGISPKKYNAELNKALKQIRRYILNRK